MAGWRCCPAPSLDSDMDKQTRRYLKNKGHNSGRFVALPYNLLESAALKNLSPYAALIFIELKRRYNGANNGSITLSCREAGVIGHCGKGTAGKKLAELVAHGFIKESSKGRFRNRHASSWVLTCEVYEGRSPSNEWKEFSKIKTPCL
jgi:hypothetical protein